MCHCKDKIITTSLVQGFNIWLDCYRYTHANIITRDAPISNFTDIPTMNISQ